MDPELLVSFDPEVGSSVELVLDSLCVIAETHIELVDFSLQNCAQNVVDLKENEESGEVHGLIDCALWFRSRGRHDHKKNSDTCQQVETHSDSIFDEEPSTMGSILNSTSHSDLHVAGNHIEISQIDNGNNYNETKAKKQVLPWSQNKYSSITFFTVDEIGQNL